MASRTIDITLLGIPRIEAMASIVKALAASDPWMDDYISVAMCLFCGALEDEPHEPEPGERCLWLEAQALTRTPSNGDTP